VAYIATAALGGDAGRIRGQAQSPPPAPAADSSAAKPAPAAAAQFNELQAGNTAGDARQQELAGQCADLLKLATDLKKAVDKSTADQLSVTVVHKASEIEQLARRVRTGSGRN
jgi:hypothetical protein